MRLVFAPGGGDQDACSHVRRTRGVLFLLSVKAISVIVRTPCVRVSSVSPRSCADVISSQLRGFISVPRKGETISVFRAYGTKRWRKSSPRPI